MSYPSDWPKCPGCGEPALDGHITCGDVRCNEAGQRGRQAENTPAKRHVCTITIDEGTRKGMVDEARRLDGMARRFTELGMSNHAGCVAQAAEVYRRIAGSNAYEIRWGGDVDMTRAGSS